MNSAALRFGLNPCTWSIDRSRPTRASSVEYIESSISRVADGFLHRPRELNATVVVQFGFSAALGLRAELQADADARNVDAPHEAFRRTPT
jgi:hypothetical protein